MFKKITPGFVVQDYDEATGKCVGQEFVAGDNIESEDEAGNPIEQPESVEYFPFELIQPSIAQGT
jgi:hypothetical protein